MSALVTITGDGTFRVPRGVRAGGTGGAHGSGSTHGTGATEGPFSEIEDPALAALVRLRALLGDDPEEQIATRLYLPSALGQDATDHLLPASLALLAGTTGDLASYGWRLGPGIGRAWQRARELRERMIDAARIALFGYEGPLALTTMGPATLAAATFLPSGERTLADRGAVRDLPMLLAEGLADHLDAVRERVPGAALHLLVREDAVGAVVAGTIPTPSGRRRYPAIPGPEIGLLWKCLLTGLASADALNVEAITLGVGTDVTVLRTAREIGVRNLAISPAHLPPLESPDGRVLWEELAMAHEDGCRLELAVDPRPGHGMTRVLDGVLETWGRLGYGPADAAGTTLIAHTGAAHAVRSSRPDPSAQPDVETLLTEPDLEALLRAAPAWAERIES